MNYRTSKRATAAFAVAAAIMFIAVFVFGFRGLAIEAAFASDASNLQVGTTPATGQASSNAAYVQAIPISSCKVSVKRSLKYTAQPLKPAPKVVYQGKKLVKGKDYTVSYKNNLGIGKAFVTVTGKDEYTGQVTKSFKIAYSNIAIAVAACRLSYSKARVNGRAVNKGNGYKGTKLYRKYAPNNNSFNCEKIIRTTINHYLRVDKKFPAGVTSARSHMRKSKYWKRVCHYTKGMEFKKNTKLRPGDVYSSADHTCIYVGNKVPRIVYKRYLKASKKMKKKLKKKCPDLGKPSKKSVWVCSHATYMNGSAAHICGPGDALVNMHSGTIYRYVGPGCKDPNKVTR